MKIKSILSFLCCTTFVITLATLQSAQGAHPSGGARARNHAADNDGRTRDPRANQRQENQHDRIKEGVKSGELTKDEAKDAVAAENELRKEEKEYKSDGVLTEDERKDLQQDLHAASKDIYDEKHDAETRPGIPKTAALKDPGVNARQENQQDRIEQGIKSGELTKKEAHSVAEKEAHLAKLERRLKEDGKLTVEERARLQRQLNFLSEDIYKQKHDEQERK